jgi:hypothetical protein
VEMLGSLEDSTTVSCSLRFNICIGRTKLFSAWQGEYVSCEATVWPGTCDQSGRN